MSGLLQRVRRRDEDAPAAELVPAAEASGVPPVTWRTRARLRRRLAHLRRAREVALRDLGGLVLELRRAGRDRPDLVAAKADALDAVDRERRALEDALHDRRDADLLRRPGLSSCPRCDALHASDARFCSNCGLLVGTQAGLPEGVPLETAAQPTAALTPPR